MIYWSPFHYQNIEYDLSHLHPMRWTLTQPAINGKPEKNYRFSVVFSLHTFTQSFEDRHDRELSYSDARETRAFCFNRYQDSFELPEIIQRLDQGYVFHTGKQNFLRIDKDNGTYEVYFVVKRSKLPDIDLDIYVQSSYKRTKGNSPKAGKIKFTVVAYNTMNNRPIKPPRR